MMMSTEVESPPTVRRIWLISDTHFGHENMYRFTTSDGVTRVRARFNSATEGDTYMIDRWNSTVSPTDHVYHIGDVAVGRPSWSRDRFVKFIRNLHGHKRLVLGNHDRLNIRSYIDAGFQKIVGMHRLFDCWLTHAPVHEMQLGEKVLGNIHGHIHYRDSPPGRYFNASVERIDYTPVDFELVRAHLESLRSEAEK